MYVSFEDWTGQRRIQSIGTNAGAKQLPFQSWRNFKEAFAPEIVAEAISESKIKVKTCLDPFGGSGTTALTCQFRGVHPISIEVNPFLADLIEAKLCSYNGDALARDLGNIIDNAQRSRRQAGSVFDYVPPSFIEPGLNGRWIFDHSVADKLAKLKRAIDQVPNKAHRRLFRVVLGGMLVEVSNVVVSGKGRRYRKNWQLRQDISKSVFPRFSKLAENAILELAEYSRRACSTFELMRGDSRKLAQKVGPHELCVFSPPYPNSFDYTDIYNVELWMLGYLDTALANRKLRSLTLSSHVQVARKYANAPSGSRTLESVTKRLKSSRDELWSHHLPEMVGAYFSDLAQVLSGVKANLDPKGSIWMVVGNSRYADVLIPTAKILWELSGELGFKVRRIETFRSMRASSQQGGRKMLAESLVVLSPL